MKNKILVIVYVPMIEQEYNLYIPEGKKVGIIKKKIIEIVEEHSEGIYKNDNAKFLYDKKSGNKIDDQLFVKNSGIVNGSQLILY